MPRIQWLGHLSFRLKTVIGGDGLGAGLSAAAGTAMTERGLRARRAARGGDSFSLRLSCIFSPPLPATARGVRDAAGGAAPAAGHGCSSVT